MKIFLACISALFIVTCLSAQQPNVINNKSSVTEFELIPKLDVINKSLKTEFDKKSVAVVHETMHLRISNDNIDNVKKKLKKYYSLSEYHEPVQMVDAKSQEKVEIKSAEKRYATEIDDFLNIEDSTIFRENFMDGLTESQVHPRSRKWWQLIVLIHSLDTSLKKIEESVSYEKVRKLAQDYGVTLNDAYNLLQGKAKEDMCSTYNIMYEFSNYPDEIEVLSEEQLKFYRNVKKRCNELYDKINPDCQSE
ncbi:MAG: hypothetical protein IKP45_04715 [Bacteroidales bacterium]|nr:hypothetical protein [Bacteroidales bacterium]